MFISTRSCIANADGRTKQSRIGVGVCYPLKIKQSKVEGESIPMAFIQIGRVRSIALLILCLTMTLGLSQATAGPLSTTNRALNDGFGPDAGRWHGSVLIAGAAFGDTLVAEVDWAAFARPFDGSTGKFQLFLNDEGIAQADPSAPGEVIYVYQITSVTSASPGVDTLTVGLDAADGRGGTLAPTFIPTGAATEKSPAGGGDNTTSMAWFFNGTELQVGDTSSLLVFTSPFAPEFDFMQVNSGLAGPVVSPLVASPSDRLFQFDIPEPSSLALGLLCCVGVLLARKGDKTYRT